MSRSVFRQRAGILLNHLWQWLQQPGAFWVLVMNAYLLSPLVYDLGLGRGEGEGVDKIVLFSLPASILALIAVQLLGRTLWQTHVLLFPFYFCVGADLYLISHYDVRLSSSTIAMALENMGQAVDFMQVEALKLAVWTLTLVTLYATALYKIRHIRVNASGRLKLLALAPLGLVYVGLTVQRCLVHGGVRLGVLDVASHDRGSPFGVLPQGYVAYLVYREVLQHAQAAASFRFGASREIVPPGREVYVLVIGESSRPDNWGLYGYSRDTTPRLALEPNLIVFEDAVTQAALTSISVPLILTRGSISSGKDFMAEKSIISVYREAGFVTSWLSTQQRDHWTGAVNRYSGEAHYQSYYERRHDEVLVRALRNVLASNPADAKHFVVVHTQGSHFVFEDRYPESMAVFPVSGAGVGHREALVNAYDNTIVYSDYVLSELIRTLAELKSPAALLYISDHGENLKDDERALFGHYFNNEYDLRIPMLLWHSDQYAKLFPERIRMARQHASRPVSTRNAFYTLAGLGGLTFPDPNLHTLNLLSPEWRPSARHVTTRSSWVDFDRYFGPRPKRRIPVRTQVSAHD